MKTDLGTLILSGANTYTGGTAIEGGTLQVAIDANLGPVAGALTFDGGTLATTASFSSARATTLNAEGGTFDVANATALTMSGAIGGAGALTKINTGTLVLTGTNTYSGATNVTAGTLQLGNGTTNGSISGNIANNAVLAFNPANGTTMSLAGVISGTGAVNQIGTGTTILTGANTYTGGTSIQAGTLQLGDGITSGSISGNVTNNAVLGFKPATGTTVTFGGVISGTGAVHQTGTGTTILTGANTYSGGTAVNGGTLQVSNDANLGAAAGALSFNGGTLVPIESFSTARATTLNAGGGTFDVAGATMLTLSGAIGGPGTLSTTNTGTLVLSGTNTYTGATNITSGTLLVQGNQSAATGSVLVASGATLGGSGTVGGGVTLANGGTLAPGNSAGTLTVGALTLEAGSMLDYELATPNIVGGGVNDLIVVAGGLTLAGTLNVSALGGFGAGSYRLMNYGGTFIDNGLAFGVLPSGFAYHLDTATGGQVNLTVTNPVSSPVQYWDGSHTVGDGVVDGGSGVWSTATNWTDANGTMNQAWGGQTAVFGGTAGTVTVVGSIAFNGLRFLTDGYSLVAGAGAELTTSTPGTVALLSPGVDVTVDVRITGTGGINIQGGGTFVTTANNGYTGGTAIAPGSTLQLGHGGTSGIIVGDVTDDGTLVFNRADTVSFSGTISGTGHVTQSGPGTLVLTGTNSYAGGTTFNAGIVSVSADANLGAPSGSLTFNGGTLHTTVDLSAARSTTIAGPSGTIDTDAQTTFSLSGAISGSGALVKIGSGRLLLSGSNTYSGGTLVSAGTLQGNTNSLQGTIVDNAALVFDQDHDGTFRGTLFGTGTLTKRGAGIVRLTGDHGLQGLTSVLAGTLELDGSLAGSVNVARGATFGGTGLIGGTLNSLGTVVVGASGAATSLNQMDGPVAANSPTAGGLGVLGVVGDITLSPGSQLHVGIDPAAGTALLVTDGRASIDGTVVVHAQKDGFSRVTQYAIADARNGLSGQAAATSTSTSLEPYLSRGLNTLFVTLLRTDIPLQPYAVTGNGWGAGGAVDRIRANATGDLLDVTRQLTALDDAQLGSALDAISGEIHASQIQLAAIDGESVMDVTRSEISSRITWRDRVKEGAQGSRASLWGSDRLRPWIRVRSDRGSFDPGSPIAGQGDRPAAHGADTMLNGVAGGLDWSFANDWLAGVGGSYVDGKMTLDDLNEQSDFSAPRVLGYLGYARDRWVMHTGLSVAHMMYDVTRRFAFAAIAPTGQPLFGTVDRAARSTPAGTASDVWVEGRYNTAIGSWDLQPRTGLRAAWYRLGHWNETGADSLSLAAAAQTNNSVQGDVGVRTSRAIGRVRPFLEGMYRRELSFGVLKTTIALTDQPGGLFEVDGIGLTVDKFVGQAGALFLTNHAGLSLLYELHHAGAQTRHGLQFGVGF